MPTLPDHADAIQAMLVHPYRLPPAHYADPADPIALDELTPHQLSWRIVLHRLAATGGTLTLPTAFLTRDGSLRTFQLDVMVGAGWQYTPQVTFPDERHVTIACRFTRDVLPPAVKAAIDAAAANPTHAGRGGDLGAHLAGCGVAAPGMDQITQSRAVWT